MTTAIVSDKRLINGWCFYDWANSVYALVMTATIFPIYFNSVTSTESSDIVTFFGRHYINTEIYSYTLSAAFLIVALMSPMLSSIADYSGKKKSFMKFFCYLGAISCMSLYFFDGSNIEFGLIAFLFTTIGFSGSIVFYNSFLPEIAPPEEHDRVSARGFSFGYFGSLILLAINLAMVMKPDLFGLTDAGQASRISFLMVGIWWIGFAQITFNRLPDNVYNRKITGNIIVEGYKEFLLVWKQLRKSDLLITFLIAFFFFNAGVQTVIYMATNFGTKEIGADSDLLIVAIMVIQVFGIVGAYGFSRLSGKFGNIKTLMVIMFIYIALCIWVYFIYGQSMYVIAAGCVGFVMGGSQALSRSTYSKMLPKTEDHATFFSIYDVMEKLSVVMGTLVFGLMEHWTGSMRNSIAILMVFFVVGIILLSRIKKWKYA